VGKFEKVFKIYQYIDEGFPICLIARKLKTSPSAILYHINLGLKNGYLKKIRRGVYKLTLLGERFLKELKKLKKDAITYGGNLNSEGEIIIYPYTRIHSLALKLPILSKSQKTDELVRWDKYIRYSNRIDKIKRLPFFTLRETGTNLIVYFHQFEVKDLQDLLLQVIKKILQLLRVVYTYEYVLDWNNGEIIHQHFAHKVNKKIEAYINQVVGERIIFEKSLNRQAKSFFPTKIEGKVWIDRSKGELEVEHNTLEYLEDVCFVPIRIREMSQEIKEIKKSISTLFASLESIKSKLENLRINSENNSEK